MNPNPGPGKLTRWHLPHDNTFPTSTESVAVHQGPSYGSELARS